MKKLSERQTKERRRSGFTAIEVTMVATVIAVLALIAIPAFIQRMDEARINAAMDEMSQIAKAQQLAFAETGDFFRLQDLDNTTRINPSGIITQPENPFFIHINVPSARWNRSAGVQQAERVRLARNWKGPYIVYQNQRTLTYAELNADPVLSQVLEGEGGPVPEFGPNIENPADEYPVDPWGTPYLFFGLGPDVNRVAETDFFNVRVYSMGPDGLPGDSQAFSPTNLVPGTGRPLGTGDDLIYKVQ